MAKKSDLIKVNLKDYSEMTLKEFDKQAKLALTACGMQAETFAKEICTKKKIVDTGFLRNSITYAVSGESPKTTSYSSNDKKRKGSYSGRAPAASEGKIAVYIGTNVEYGMYQEIGTCKMKARPFIKPALSDYRDYYEEIIEDYLSGE